MPRAPDGSDSPLLVQIICNQFANSSSWRSLFWRKYMASIIFVWMAIWANICWRLRIGLSWRPWVRSYETSNNWSLDNSHTVSLKICDWFIHYWTLSIADCMTKALFDKHDVSEWLYSRLSVYLGHLAPYSIHSQCKMKQHSDIRACLQKLLLVRQFMNDNS
jgi:hypothetical protein